MTTSPGDRRRARRSTPRRSTGRPSSGQPSSGQPSSGQPSTRGSDPDRAEEEPVGSVADTEADMEQLRAEPEPAWADEIRAGRRARAAKLRSVFASFDEPADEGSSDGGGGGT